MIQGGLWLNFIDHTHENKVGYKFCCLAEEKEQTCDFDVTDFWSNNYFTQHRISNLENKWAQQCMYPCKKFESLGNLSLRQSMNAISSKKYFTGPVRIDVKLDNACNLACRICGEDVSTFWQKHLRENNLPTYSKKLTYDPIKTFKFLDQIDLSLLQNIKFCGGETLLGNSCFEFLEYIKKRSKPNQISISFQTNGTLCPTEKQMEMLESFRLVKLNVSLDGIKNRFNYLRWPADWNRTIDNLFLLREKVPVNTMFLIEETLSIFNYYYKDECKNWVQTDFAINRLGDKVDYSCHHAYGTFSLLNLSKEYCDYLGESFNSEPNENNIKNMITIINQFDKIRNQSWKDTFPEVYNFYSRYI